MGVKDLFLMSITSLWRRKLRTVLTVLGVVVGTASIVVMISLGLGIQKANMEEIEEYGGLTTIAVYSGDEYSSSSGDSEPLRINDDTIEQFSQMEHVEVASGILSVSMIAKIGKYQSYFTVQGMSIETLEKLGLDLAEGELPKEGDELKFIYGNAVLADFYNAKTYEYYWETGELPDIDLMNDSIFIIMDEDTYWNYSSGGTDENGNPISAPKKYLIPAAAVLSGTVKDYNEYSYYVLCDVEALKTALQKEFKGRTIPGQPTDKNGKPYKEIYYNRAYISVDNINNVEEVQELIQSMGYETQSNADWMDQVKQSSRSIQLLLGGIGGVALLVAAIGIANTMTMSIYERTKEIGIYKVLGCDMNSIRNMFLTEAAFIGFMGGVAGIILSFGISAIVNLLTAESLGYSTGISYIPFYLVLGALVFAVVVGMLAGLFPSIRAMKLSPLAAIRNE